MGETYEIHDFLAVETNDDLPLPDYFTTETSSLGRRLVVESVDEIETGAPASSRRLASHRYWRTDDGIVVAYPSTPTGKRAVVELSGIGDDETVIRYTPTFRENVDFEGLLEALVTRKLLDAGVALVHAAGIVCDGRATVLASMGRMGKTSTTLSVLGRRDDLGFMGDNVLLLDREGTAYAWPATLGVFPGTAVADETLPGDVRFRVRLKRILARSDFVAAALLHKFSVDLSEDLSPSAVASEITETAPVDHFYLLNGGYPETGVYPLTAREAAPRVATGTDMELSPEDYYLSLFAFTGETISAHTGEVVQHRRSIVVDALEDIQIQELRANDVTDYVSLLELNCEDTA